MRVEDREGVRAAVEPDVDRRRRRARERVRRHARVGDGDGRVGREREPDRAAHEVGGQDRVGREGAAADRDRPDRRAAEREGGAERAGAERLGVRLEDREGRLGDVDREATLELQLLHVAQILLGRRRRIEGALAAEPDRLLGPDVELLLAAAEVHLGEGRAVDRLAALVRDHVAVAVEHRRRGVGDHVVVRIRDEAERAARGRDDRVADVDGLAAEVRLDVGRSVEGLERQRHRQRHRAVELRERRRVERVQREHAGRLVEREAGAFVEREDALVAGDDDGHDPVGLVVDPQRVDRAQEVEAPAGDEGVRVGVEPRGGQRQRHRRVEARRREVGDAVAEEGHRARHVGVVVCVRDHHLAGRVREQRAVEVDDRPAELVEHGLATDVRARLAGGVQQRIACVVLHRVVRGERQRDLERISDRASSRRVELAVACRVVRVEHDVAERVLAHAVRVLAAEVELLVERVVHGERPRDRGGRHGQRRAADAPADDRLVGRDRHGALREIALEAQDGVVVRVEQEGLRQQLVARGRVDHPDDDRRAHLAVRDQRRARQRDRVARGARRELARPERARGDHGHLARVDRCVAEGDRRGAGRERADVGGGAVVEDDSAVRRVDPVERLRHRRERAIGAGVGRRVDDQLVVTAGQRRARVLGGRERDDLHPVDLDQRRDVEAGRAEEDLLARVDLRVQPVAEAGRARRAEDAAALVDVGQERRRGSRVLGAAVARDDRDRIRLEAVEAEEGQRVDPEQAEVLVGHVAALRAVDVVRLHVERALRGVADGAHGADRRRSDPVHAVVADLRQDVEEVRVADLARVHGEVRARVVDEQHGRRDIGAAAARVEVQRDAVHKVGHERLAVRVAVRVGRGERLVAVGVEVDERVAVRVDDDRRA